MMQRTRIALLSLLGAILLACAIGGVVWYQSTIPPPVTAGKVVDHRFTPHWTEHWIYQQPVYQTRSVPYQSCSSSGYGNNARTSCTTQYRTESYVAYYQPIPRTTFHPDKWTLTLEACKDNNPNKCRRSGHTVSQLTYNTVKLGSWYDTKHPTTTGANGG